MSTPKPSAGKGKKQLLHLVFGGELTSVGSTQFREDSPLDVVGIFPSYDEAEAAWVNKARETIDNAQMRYFVVPLNKILDPASK